MIFSDNINHEDIEKINLEIISGDNLVYLNYFDEEATNCCS